MRQAQARGVSFADTADGVLKALIKTVVETALEEEMSAPDTISRISDKIIGDMQDWVARPLEPIYAAIFPRRDQCEGP